MLKILETITRYRARFSSFVQALVVIDEMLSSAAGSLERILKRGDDSPPPSAPPMAVAA